MNFKTTAILAVTLILVIVSLFVFKNTDQETKKVQKAILDGLKSQDIKSIKLTNADGKTLFIEKKGTDWNITQPYNALADSYKVDSLVRSITDLKSLGEDADSSLKTLRLDNPAFKIEIVAKQTWKLDVSSKPTIGQNCYAMLNAASIRNVVPDTFVDTLETPFDQYRSMKILNMDSSSVKQLSIKSGTADPIELEKYTAYDWRITKPQKLDAETLAVNDFAITLTGLNASAFVDESSIPTLANPLKFPVSTIWLSTESPTTQPVAAPTSRPAGITLSISDVGSLKKDPSVYIHISPDNLFAKVPASSVANLKKSLLDFKDRKIVQIDPKQVSKIRLVATKNGETKETLIERRKVDLTLGPASMPTSRPATKPANEDLPVSDWTLIVNKSSGSILGNLANIKDNLKGAQEASNAEVEKLLARFNPLRAQEFLPADAAPVTQPAATYKIEITAEIAGQSSLFTLDLLDVGDISTPIATYKDTSFKLSRLFLESMTADYVNKPTPPEMPDMMGMPEGMGGLPPGMMGM